MRADAHLSAVIPGNNKTLTNRMVSKAISLPTYLATNTGLAASTVSQYFTVSPSTFKHNEES